MFLTTDLFRGRLSGIIFSVLDPLGAVALPLHESIQFLIVAHQIVPSFVLCWACWADHRGGIVRHWSHWCGVIVFLSGLPGAIMVACMNLGWLPSPVLVD